MDHLYKLLDQLDGEIEMEQSRITKAITYAKTKSERLNENYWERLHKLRLKKRTLLIVLQAFADEAALKEMPAIPASEVRP